MSGGIFLVQDNDDLVEMTEQGYDKEDVLQDLLARYPSLLAGDQINAEMPRRWLLIAREMGVASEERGEDRWAVDHLFVDQDAVPTIVEVKRRSDTRIRREVVGQMLDYAANAVVYWPIETIRSWFEASCTEQDLDPERVLDDFLEEEDNTERFWQAVKTNLQAGRVRLMFVADEIPAELRRIVEFLNEQMDPAEVLALEVKQYVGNNLKTLVPKVVGQTAEAQRKKSSTGRTAMQWTEERFLQKLAEDRGGTERRVAQQIFDWTKKRKMWVRWGRGEKIGTFYPGFGAQGERLWVCVVWTSGEIEFTFGTLKTISPFDQLALRQEFLSRINQLTGVALAPDRVNKNSWIRLSDLAEEKDFQIFLETLEWAHKQLNGVQPKSD